MIWNVRLTLPAEEGLNNCPLWYGQGTLGQAEVDEFDFERLQSVVDQHHIVRLDVSVREADAPQSLKGCCELSDHQNVGRFSTLNCIYDCKWSMAFNRKYLLDDHFN